MEEYEGRLEEFDGIENPTEWLSVAQDECMAIWVRVGRRYARRLIDQNQVRDAQRDVMALAARHLVPLAESRLRPLPLGGLCRAAQAFNRLDVADRRVLRHMDRFQPLSPERGAHAASALERLFKGYQRLPAETEATRDKKSGGASLRGTPASDCLG